MPARVAAVRREAQPALQRNQCSVFHSISRNMFQIKVAAARTMRVNLKAARHAPRVKPALARMATPRPRSIHAVQEIQDAVAMGSKTINASALRTDHRAPYLPLLSTAQNIENRTRGQDFACAKIRRRNFWPRSRNISSRQTWPHLPPMRRISNLFPINSWTSPRPSAIIPP